MLASTVWGLLEIRKTISSSELNQLQLCEDVWGTQDYRPRWTNVPFWCGPKPPEVADAVPFLQPCEGALSFTDPKKVSIIDMEHSGTFWKLEYLSTVDSGLSIPQFFYPEWDAFIDGLPMEVNPTVGEGLVSLTLPEGNHTVRIEYQETTTRKIGNALSLVAIIILAIASFAFGQPKREGKGELPA